MQVSLSQKLNQPTTYKPAFKSELSTYLLATRISLLAERAEKVIVAKNEIANTIKNPINTEEVRTVISNLSVLSSKTDKGFWYHLGRMFSFKQLKQGTPKIGEMKNLALEKLFPVLDDNNGFNRAAKTALLSSMLTTGEYLSDTFVNTFKNLPDRHYYAFKQELVNRVLYTGNASKEPERHIYNFRLLQTIDNPNYAGFLQNNALGINNLIALLDRESYQKLTQKKNLAFEYYCKDFPSYGDNNIWQPHLQNAFYKRIQKAEFQPEKIEAELKVTREQAEDIVKDLQALSLAERRDNPEEILKKRIKEKLKTKDSLYLIDKITKQDYFANEEYAEMSMAELKLDNIKTFISRTNCQDALNEEFKTELSKLEQAYYWSEQRYTKAQEQCDRESDLTAWAHQL